MNFIDSVKFLIRVHTDGTVEGDYWTNVEKFEFAKAREKANKASGALSRITEMQAKLDIAKNHGYAKKSAVARVLDKRKKKPA